MSVGVCCQTVRNELEEKRPLVEHSLNTGRLYLRQEGLEDKRLSTDSADGSDVSGDMPDTATRDTAALRQSYSRAWLQQGGLQQGYNRAWLQQGGLQQGMATTGRATTGRATTGLQQGMATTGRATTGHGYNREGYNREGYNRATTGHGYNREGYNRATTGHGYNREGYNRATIEL